MSKTKITTKRLGAHRATFIGLTPTKARLARANEFFASAAAKLAKPSFRPAAAAPTSSTMRAFFAGLPAPWRAATDPQERKLVDFDGNGKNDVIGLNFPLVPGGTHVLRELHADNTTWIERGRVTAGDGPSFWGVFQPLDEETGNARYVFELVLLKVE